MITQTLVLTSVLCGQIVLPISINNYSFPSSFSSGVISKQLKYTNQSKKNLEELILKQEQELQTFISSLSIYYPMGDKVVEYLKIEDFDYDDIVLHFKNEYKIQYSFENGYYYAHDKNIGVNCFGKNLDDLAEDVKENIGSNWEMYVKCDINELSSDAIRLRERLSVIVGECQ